MTFLVTLSDMFCHISFVAVFIFSVLVICRRTADVSWHGGFMRSSCTILHGPHSSQSTTNTFVFSFQGVLAGNTQIAATDRAQRCILMKKIFTILAEEDSLIFLPIFTPPSSSCCNNFPNWPLCVQFLIRHLHHPHLQIEYWHNQYASNAGQLFPTPPFCTYINSGMNYVLHILTL